MGKFKCVFRNCSTIDTLGVGVMPPACAAKGCTGVFERKPGCRTFMQDALAEPIIKASDWKAIKPIKTRFIGEHFGILMPCKNNPARAVLQA